MKKILITGVAGFIGSNLADRLLEEGCYELIGIDNLASGLREQVPGDVRFYQGDIRSKEIYPLFENVDFVFHLAAKNCISDCQESPVETAEINVAGSVNVFEACRRAHVKRVVYAETAALYEGSDVFPTPESLVRPRTFYAVSKLAVRQFGEAYRRFHGLNFTALRYFCVYGPRQDYRRSIPPVFSAFIWNLLQGKRPVIYGTGEKRRDFIHVEDVNDFHLLCLQDERTANRVFNLGSGVSYSINDIYNRICRHLKISLPAKHRPDLPGEPIETRADISEARKIGWLPRISLETGIRDSIQYLKGILGSVDNNAAFTYEESQKWRLAT